MKYAAVSLTNHGCKIDKNLCSKLNFLSKPMSLLFNSTKGKLEIRKQRLENIQLQKGISCTLLCTINDYKTKVSFLFHVLRLLLGCQF